MRIRGSTHRDIVEGAAGGRRQDGAEEGGRQDLRLLHVRPVGGIRHIPLTVATSSIAPVRVGAGETQSWPGIVLLSNVQKEVSKALGVQETRQGTTIRT